MGGRQFSPDSRRIALAHTDGELLVYDLATGRQIARWRMPNSGHLAFRPDGAQIAVLHNEPGNSTCRILEAETGRLVRSIPLPSRPESGRLEPRRHHAGNAVRRFQDLPLGRRHRHPQGDPRRPYQPAVCTAAFHPAGTLLASNGWERRLRLWDPVLGRPVLSLTGDDSVPCTDSARTDGSSFRSRTN